MMRWWARGTVERGVECAIAKTFRGCPVRSRGMCMFETMCKYPVAPLTKKEMASRVVSANNS